jgi:hypothetical protein
VGDFANSTQVHDFEPGIEPSGLFWTTPVPKAFVDARPQRGTGRMSAIRLAVDDYHDFTNAVAPTPANVKPSHVSFDVRWHGGNTVSNIRDETYGFVGSFVSADATIDFKCRNDGSPVVYRSHPVDQITVSGGTGRERNGVFFN